MPLDPPQWWYPEGKNSGILPALLPWLMSPASALYGAGARYRLTRQPDYASTLPVICIGNFTAGGTGKTPLAIEIANRLKALGCHPAFLTRGYGGTALGPYDVDLTRDTAARTGDEPLLLARAAPTVIARDRTRGARQIERMDADVIIMDDGMQNPSLAKTLTIAVVDGSRGVGNGWTIPSGPLRAPLCAQARMVDLIVINGQAGHSTTTGFVPDNFAGTILHGRLEPVAGAVKLAGTPVIAFSGIGNPARFYKTLEDCGARISERHSFPDHHAFTEANASMILRDAADRDAMIVTTEKDLVRLAGAGSGTSRAKLLEQSYALPVTFTFQESDSGRLDALLDMIVRDERPIYLTR